MSDVRRVCELGCGDPGQRGGGFFTPFRMTLGGIGHGGCRRREAIAVAAALKNGEQETNG